jgi:hypothetical protein
VRVEGCGNASCRRVASVGLMAEGISVVIGAGACGSARGAAPFERNADAQERTSKGNQAHGRIGRCSLETVLHRHGLEGGGKPRSRGGRRTN